uniref:Uncharacterized protein n=1 Tax=Solanum tuberosum TaxID=4113 RepID=M1CJ09_SOLTU
MELAAQLLMERQWISLNVGVAVAGEDGESEGDVIHRSFDEIHAKRRRIMKGERGRESWFAFCSGSSKL